MVANGELHTRAVEQKEAVKGVESKPANAVHEDLWLRAHQRESYHTCPAQMEAEPRRLLVKPRDQKTFEEYLGIS